MKKGKLFIRDTKIPRPGTTGEGRLRNIGNTLFRNRGKRQKGRSREIQDRHTKQKRGEKMNTFDDCIENRLQKIRKTLLLKAKEYASNDNRFHNFDVAAHILNGTPERALQGMMLKHIVSIFDLIEWTEVNEQLITESLINEKIGDTINYLILLEGLLLRRINMKEKEGEIEQRNRKAI